MTDYQLSPHFKLSEFIISDTRSSSLNFDNVCAFFEHSDEIIERLLLLVRILEVVRTIFKKPIKITSGYRCPSVNISAGGVSNSRHLQGLACDMLYSRELADLISRLRQLGTIQLKEFIVNPQSKYVHIAL